MIKKIPSDENFHFSSTSTISRLIKFEPQTANFEITLCKSQSRTSSYGQKHFNWLLLAEFVITHSLLLKKLFDIALQKLLRKTIVGRNVNNLTYCFYISLAHYAMRICFSKWCVNLILCFRRLCFFKFKMVIYISFRYNFIIFFVK